jgi:transposase
VDESYLGGGRKGKQGRGVAGKVPVFGLLKRSGRVYTVMIPNARKTTLVPIMERMIQPNSIVYTDSFSSYDALDISSFHHIRINHSKLFADKHNYSNGI